MAVFMVVCAAREKEERIVREREKRVRERERDSTRGACLTGNYLTSE